MCETRTLFARHGVRCTRQRVLLYNTLAASRRHLTVEELHAQVNRAVEGLSLSTVYNTMEALCDCGLCHKLPANGRGARYDADLREHMHIITGDGRVVDVPEELGIELLNALPRSVLTEVERRTGVRIRRVSIELLGESIESENTGAKHAVRREQG